MKIKIDESEELIEHCAGKEIEIEIKENTLGKLILSAECSCGFRGEVVCTSFVQDFKNLKKHLMKKAFQGRRDVSKTDLHKLPHLLFPKNL